MPKISALMPVYNGAKYLSESITSIQNQTFQDWEFIIVSEFVSADMSAVIIDNFAKNDNRIHVIRNSERIGLAESLNVGIRQATGDYIARVDVDDPSYPERFQKQVDFLDTHPDIFLCGSWQYSVTPNNKTVQEVPVESAEIKAAMLFGCEINHCSVMMRRKMILDNNWFYDGSFLSEDFELWTRIMDKAEFANLGEPLVDHRWGFGNISITKGEALRAETRALSARSLERFLGIDVQNIDKMLLSGWRNQPKDYAEYVPDLFLKKAFDLLEEIDYRNLKTGFFNHNALTQVLQRRWDWVCDCCGLSFESNLWDILPSDKMLPQLQYCEERKEKATVNRENRQYANSSSSGIGRPSHQGVDTSAASNNQTVQPRAPKVTVLIPIYNSAQHLRKAIDSILLQDFADWDMLVINEKGSDDGSAEIVRFYAKYDSRIKLIQNEERLGLAESLNLGIRLAEGEYIARLDADDISHPTRFSKQVALLDANPQVGVCGSWQHHFGNGVDWVHKPSATAAQCKADLLFACHLCHSTLMLRKSVFLENSLFYDDSFFAEDFELWTRVIGVTDITNIPEILGEYRHNDQNITNTKKGSLREESGHIVAASIKRYLGIDLPENEHMLLSGWDSIYEEELNSDKRELMLSRFQEILMEIWNANLTKKLFDNKALMTIIAQKWRWAKYNIDWKQPMEVHSIKEVFNKRYHEPLNIKWERFNKNNPTLTQKCKKIIVKIGKKVLHPFAHGIQWRIKKILIEALGDVGVTNLESNLDSRVWSAEERIIELTGLITQLSYESHAVPFSVGEKIRVVFLFQIAAFWASMDQLYNALIKDNRFDVTVVCYDKDIDYTIKVDTAEEYLINNNIPYMRYEQFNLHEFNPHVVFLQTPYDRNRDGNYTSVRLKQLGIRVVYMSYGVEFPDTDQAREDHYLLDFYLNIWRLYTFSNASLQEYNQYCSNSKAVRALGTPRFDALWFKDRYSINPEIERMANGRKIVLWKVHFPKTNVVDGKIVMVTPELQVYFDFASEVKNFPNLFFVFMPHPRFVEFNADNSFTYQAQKLLRILKSFNNVYIDFADDYRPQLLNANCIIVDRSAVMVEAGSTGIPVMYMTNEDYKEPLTKALAPLIESYYQGETSEDMVNFINMFDSGKDPRRQVRLAAWEKCIPFFDGKCSERIADDIAQAIAQESSLKNRKV